MFFPASPLPLGSPSERLDTQTKKTASTETIPVGWGSTRNRSSSAHGIDAFGMSRRLLVRVLLVLLTASQPAALIAASPGSSGSPASGTYRGRVLSELFRHRQERARQSEVARHAALPELAPVLQEDAGDIAVIDDSDLEFGFSRRPGGAEGEGRKG